MKVLHVIASADPAVGGTIEGLLRIVTTMAKSGHESELVTLDKPDAPWLTDIAFPVHAMGPRTHLYGYTPRLTPWLCRNIERYDIAIMHGIWNYSSFGAWRALAGSSVPYVLFTHGMLDPWFRKAYPRKHWVKQLYWLLAEGRVLRDAKRVLFTADDEQRLAAGVFFGYNYCGQVVGFGTADPPPASQPQTDAWYALMPSLKGRSYFLFLSRIHPKKGCDLLIDAFAKVADLHSSLDLVIAGPDQIGWRQELEQRAPGLADRIHWPGMLTGDAKWGAFRNAEAFVLPSHQENFGIAVAEAMACGRLVLITDKINIWREVAALGGGLVESDTVDGVRALLERALAMSEEDRRIMGQRARDGFLKHFEMEEAVAALASVLEQVRSSARRSPRKGL